MISEATKVVGLARVGQTGETVVYGTITELLNVDFGAPLHSMVVLGTLHEMEEAFLETFRVADGTPRLPPPKDASDSSSSDSDSD